MIKIKSIKPLDDFWLYVVFADGKEVYYDVKEDMTLPGYTDLKHISGLFQQVQIDQSHTCIFWNDYIDLPSDTLYEYGKEANDTLV